MAKKLISDVERFFKSVEICIGSCWIWTGRLDRSGYPGSCSTGSRIDGSRRSYQITHFIYQNCVGPIPVGLQLDHLCRQRCCVNPAHLEPVTHVENRFRARWAFCGKGHRMNGDNVCLDSRGYRYCRICKKEYSQKYRAEMSGGWNNYVRRQQKKKG